MRKKTKSVIAIIVIIIFVIAFVLPVLNIFQANATTLSGAQQNTQQAQEKLKIAKKKQAEADAQRKKIDSQLNKINDGIQGIENNLKGLNLQLDKENKEVEKANQQLLEKKGLFDKRIQFIYEHGTSSYIQILFAAENLNDFFYRYELISQLLEYDKKIINKVNEAKKVLEEKKASTEQMKGKIEKELTAKTQQQQAYEEKQKEAKAVLAKLTEDVEAYEQAYNAAKQQEEALKRQLSAALKGSTVKYSGEKFAWPTPGYYTVTSPYGYRFHPTLKVNKFHTGTDIGAPTGATVIAMNSGVVIMAGYNSAYGNYVIIDHGGGYSSLYAHASSLSVSKGQTVTRGQTIMKVGSTGFSTGPHLHFEILVNGQTTDPMSYF